MKIDMHVHTMEGSACGQSKVERQIEAAMAKGLDAVVITDHNTLMTKEELRFLNASYPGIRVFGGVELRLQYGIIDEEIIVIGVHDTDLLDYTTSYEQLHTFVRQKGGYMILAHPYRFSLTMDLDLANYPVDAIELYSTNLDGERVDLRYHLAKTFDLDMVVNSDSHHESTIGKHYTILNGKAHSHEALIRLLQEGHLTLSHDYDSLD